MVHNNPLLPQVFKILASQGWVPVSEETPNLLRKPKGKLSDGFRFVTEKAVETFGVLPIKRTPHIQFVTENARHLF
jgi:hypothetical protein